MDLAIATILTRGSWLEEARDTDRRLALMRELVGRASDCALVVLPAGFFVCGSTAARNRTTESVLQLMRNFSCVVAWGIDVRGTNPQTRSAKGGDEDESDRDPTLPWYGYLAEGGSARLVHAQQLAYKSSQSVSADRLPRDRVHEIAGTRVGLMICGEILAGVHGRGRAIEKLRDAFGGSDVIVGVAHANIAIRGFTRWTTAIAAAARCADTRFVALAQHLDVENLEGRKFATGGKAPRLASRRANQCWQRRESLFDPGGVPAALIDVYEVAV